MRDEDVDRRLRLYAVRWRAEQAPAAPPELSRFPARAPAYRLVGLGAAAAALVIVWAALLLLPDRDPPTVAGPTDPQPATTSGQTVPSTVPSPSASGGQQCQPTDLRPSFLPWIAEGDPIPEPEAYDAPAGPQSDGVILSWHAPSSTFQAPYSVVLRQYSDPIGAGGDEVPIRHLGELGNFYEGTAPGLGAIMWESPDSPCNILALELNAYPRMTREETRQTLIRVAESLR